MSDINTLRQLCAGIIQHENGKQPYSEDQLNTGVSAALGLTTLESPKRYSGNAAFDAASPQQQAAYLRQSMELRNQARTQFKAQLVDQVQDATAAYLKGISSIIRLHRATSLTLSVTGRGHSVLTISKTCALPGSISDLSAQCRRHPFSNMSVI